MTFDERQRAFIQRVPDLESGTLVVVPSLSFPLAELRKIVGVQRYEERQLYLLLRLRRPDARVVFASSQPVEPAIVEYYLSFLPDPVDARRRLLMVTVDNPQPRPLSTKLIVRPDVCDEIRAFVGGAADAYMVPFNATPPERALAELLGLPLYAPHPALARLGSKSGAREIARQAGVDVLDGAENLRTVAAVEQVAQRLRDRSAEVAGVVVKLNGGFSGQGNAIIANGDIGSPLTAARTAFCAAEESWPSFATKIADDGAIVEELCVDPALRSPSVQLRVLPGGVCQVVSTHDQILGGPLGQVYLGCRFPAREEYREAIRTRALGVGEVLAARGVLGWFAIDFLVRPGAAGDLQVYLVDINLRMGGTTHPYWMTRYATQATADPRDGSLAVKGQPRYYVATDNLKSPGLVGTAPAAMIERVAAAGLAFDGRRGTGVMLHLLGAVREHGKFGATCVGASRQEADELYDRLHALVGMESP